MGARVFKTMAMPAILTGQSPSATLSGLGLLATEPSFARHDSGRWRNSRRGSPQAFARLVASSPAIFSLPQVLPDFAEIRPDETVQWAQVRPFHEKNFE
jgi:hypothetical protein